MIRVRFNLDAANTIECQWSIFSGHERYLHNGVEKLSHRSFATTGSREFSVAIDGHTKTLRIVVCFRPSLKTLWRSNGLVAEAFVDETLVVADLLEPQYRVRSKLAKLVWSLPTIFAAVLLLIFVDAQFFEGRILGLKMHPAPVSIQITNAALATPECRRSLDDYDSSLLLSERKAIELRQREMNRTSGWIIDDHRTAVSTIMTIYSQVKPACRHSIRKLLDRYLINGADINQRFSTFNMTVLESAIIGGEADSVCMLLNRGASLQERVLRRRGNGHPSRITGMTLLETARYFAETRQDPDQQQVIANIDEFLATGNCTHSP